MSPGERKGSLKKSEGLPRILASTSGWEASGKGKDWVEGLTLKGRPSQTVVLYTEPWNHQRSVSKPQATPRPFAGDSLGRDLALGFLKAPLSFQYAAKVEHLCFKPNKQTKHWTISPSLNVFWFSGLESGGRRNNVIDVLTK